MNFWESGVAGRDLIRKQQREIINSLENSKYNSMVDPQYWFLHCYQDSFPIIGYFFVLFKWSYIANSTKMNKT